MICQECNGTGSVYAYEGPHSSTDEHSPVPCQECRGYGEKPSVGGRYAEIWYEVRAARPEPGDGRRTWVYPNGRK